MSKQSDKIFYAVKSKVRKIFRQDDSEKRVFKRYAGKKILTNAQMNEYIKQSIASGKPFMAGRFGGFELLAMRSAEFNQKKKMEEAIVRLDQSAGFFPAEVSLLAKFNEVMKIACEQLDALGFWFVTYEDYYIKKYCKNLSSLGSLMSLEPWRTMQSPWTKALEGKRVLVIHPFEETIRKQYQKRELLFENKDMLPEFTLVTLRAVQTSGTQKDDRFETWFDALEFMCRQCDEIDFDVALIGCGAYGFPLAAHIKKQGRQAIHLGGVLQILFGIKGRRWDESETHLLYNEHWVYPEKSETPIGAAKVEGACYWALEEKEEK